MNTELPARTPSTRAQILGFLASMAAVSGNHRMADGYLHELIHWAVCAHREFDVTLTEVQIR